MGARTIHIRAWRAVDAILAGGGTHYDRMRMLPRLLPVVPTDIASDTPGVQRDIVRRLALAIRAERSRGRAGHWTYDLNRHIGLMQAHRQEARRLGAAGRPAKKGSPAVASHDAQTVRRKPKRPPEQRP